MNVKDINAALAALGMIAYELENEYIDNGGEITERTEQMEAEKEAIEVLLTTEGVDFLGRWLKAKEDEAKALKAEKDYITRQIDSVGNTIDYIKSLVYQVMVRNDKEKVKGNHGYSFTTDISIKTTVDKDVLKDMYLQKVEEALRGGADPIIPADVTITLGASVKAVPEGADLPGYFTRNETPTVTFRKPKASKEA